VWSCCACIWCVHVKPCVVVAAVVVAVVVMVCDVPRAARLPRISADVQSVHPAPCLCDHLNHHHSPTHSPLAHSTNRSQADSLTLTHTQPPYPHQIATTRPANPPTHPPIHPPPPPPPPVAHVVGVPCSRLGLGRECKLCKCNCRRTELTRTSPACCDAEQRYMRERERGGGGA
jgi:hypothetical protein